MGLVNEGLAEQTGAAPEIRLDARALMNRIMRASAIYGLANLGIRGLNFLLLPVYTHYLSPADYGMIALAETLAMFMLQVINLGFDASIQRLYFQHVDPAEELSSYVGSALRFAFALEATFLVLVFTVGPWLQRSLRPHAAVPFQYLGMAITTAAATQFFTYRLVLCQAEKRPKAYAVLALLSFGLTATSSVTLVAFARLGVKGMLGGKLLAAVICFVIAVALGWHALRSRFDWQHVRDTIAMGAPLVPHQLMAAGLLAADRFILAHYRDLREVGIYTVGYTLGMMMSMVTISLNQAWAPIYYDTAREGESGHRTLGKICSAIVIVLVGIACVGALFARDFIAYFLDKRYATAERLVPWIIGAYLMHSLFSMFALAALQARRTKVIMGASFLALVLNTLLNFALIPKWGMYGASYATFLAYVVEAVVMYFLAQRIFRLEYDLSRAFMAIAVFLVALTITQIQWNPAIRTVVVVVTATICLGLLAMLGKNQGLRILRSRLP